MCTLSRVKFNGQSGLECTIPKPLYDDTFWSTTIHYLSLKDIYHLILTHSHFYKNIHLGEILRPMIEKKLIKHYGLQDTLTIKNLSQKYEIFLSGDIINQIDGDKLLILIPQENYQAVENTVYSKWGYLPIERKFSFCRREPFKHNILLNNSSNKYIEFLKIVDSVEMSNIQKYIHADFGLLYIIKGSWLFF